MRPNSGDDGLPRAAQLPHILRAATSGKTTIAADGTDDDDGAESWTMDALAASLPPAVSARLQAISSQRSTRMDKVMDAEDEDGAFKVRPQPGFVVETRYINIVAAGKDDDAPEDTDAAAPAVKLFINVAHSPEIPPPPPVSDEELVRALETLDGGLYRVPMSVGDGGLRDMDSSDGDQGTLHAQFITLCVLHGLNLLLVR